ncbi:MAG: hypothetical protein OEY99_06475, partial [Aigarchaeota archaeon]|nr:hypothetical protein [Aigarchaeota archaeon]
TGLALKPFDRSVLIQSEILSTAVDASARSIRICPSRNNQYMHIQALSTWKSEVNCIPRPMPTPDAGPASSS